VCRSGAAFDCLIAYRVGRMMAAAGLTHEVRYAASLSILDVVPVLKDGMLRR
jgi:phosphosulfolactate phosphohydrolase-like enzyme